MHLAMRIFLYYFRNFNKKSEFPISGLYKKSCTITQIIKIIQFEKRKLCRLFYWNARLQLLKIKQYRAQKS